MISGVPQGSGLEPLLFCCTYSPLATSLHCMNITDDLQLYCNFGLTATALAATLHHMDDCLDVVNMWMISNYM